MDEYPVTRVPFAMIDEITDDSPAAEDGLQLGDQIIKFGNVEMGDEVVRRLASEAQSNQGLLVPLVIMRQGSLMNLTVTPRQWQGRGLLGYDHILFPFIHLKIIAKCLGMGWHVPVITLYLLSECNSFLIILASIDTS